MPPQANAAAARNAKAKSTAEELEAAEARREAEKEEPRIEDIIHRCVRYPSMFYAVADALS